MTDGAVLARRLARLRAERDEGAAAIRATIGGLIPLTPTAGPPDARRADSGLGERLALAVGGELVRGCRGNYVRCEPPSIPLPLDRARLARLPGPPDTAPPLVCLDVETTGLGTASGTLAFLVGLGWWESGRFRQLGLLLPDQSEEPALLEAVAGVLPPGAWLVTYNGRAFDWPLLTGRFRLARSPVPRPAGHLDLLPLARRLFRHRLPDARLGTVERELLDLRRGRDVEGWQIPGLYLDFLRGGPAAPLLDVLRHNEEDVRSLARLLQLLARDYADPAGRAAAPAGDLAGLGRAYRDAGRLEEALACLEEALAASGRTQAWEAPWGSAPLPWGARPWDRPLAFPAGGREALRTERAHLLRRLGRADAALAAWIEVANDGGAGAPAAWIEVAKAHEHRGRDPRAALEAVEQARTALGRARLTGRRLPRLEDDLLRREARLRRSIARRWTAPGVPRPGMGPPADRPAVPARRPPSGGRAPRARVAQLAPA